jgi:DNA-binding transcriptional regulator YhcF (GntR family)
LQRSPRTELPPYRMQAHRSHARCRTVECRPDGGRAESSVRGLRVSDRPAGRGMAVGRRGRNISQDGCPSGAWWCPYGRSWPDRDRPARPDGSILSGEFPPQAVLPSERELIARYGTTKSTAGKAIALLQSEGLVTTEFGRETFVRNRPTIRRISAARRHAVHRSSGKPIFDAAAISQGQVPSRRMLEVGYSRSRRSHNLWSAFFRVREPSCLGRSCAPRWTEQPLLPPPRPVAVSCRVPDCRL